MIITPGKKFIFLLLLVVVSSLSYADDDPVTIYRILFAKNCELRTPVVDHPDSTKWIGEDSLKGYELKNNDLLLSKQEGFILLQGDDGALLQVDARTEFEFQADSSQSYFQNIRGNIFVRANNSDLKIKLDDNLYTIASVGTYLINYADICQIIAVDEKVSIDQDNMTVQLLQASEAYAFTDDSLALDIDEFGDIIDPFQNNLEYLLDIDDDELDENFSYEFPSLQKSRKIFKSRFKGTFGTVRYEGTRYYLPGCLGYIRLYDIKIALDIFFSFQSDLSFRKDDWDALDDFISKIFYIKYNDKYDDFYIRGGVIKDISYGDGLLVSRYCNIVQSPFERKAGLNGKITLSKFGLDYFVNSLRYPTIMGGRLNWRKSEALDIGLTFVGDINKYIDLDDKDGDNYPDELDPNPGRANASSDSVVEARDLMRLDDLWNQSVYGFGVDIFHRLADYEYYEVNLAGEIGQLFMGGAGLSFPNIEFYFKYFSVGVGFDAQTPKFTSGFFDADYEREKASWKDSVTHDGDTLTYLVTKEEEVQDVEDFLVGWNDRIRINIPDVFSFHAKYRQVQRGDELKKDFYSKFVVKTKKIPYLTKLDFFVDQDQTENIFSLRQPASTWGVELGVRPHYTVNIIGKYKEINEDKNDNGEISAGEVEREVSMRAAVDFQYYFDRAKRWWRNRSEEEAEEGL